MVVHKTLVLYCACAYKCVCNRESSSLSTQVFRSIAVSDVTSMSIVKQCYVLDSILGTQCTNEVLNNPGLSLRDIKKRVLEADHLKIIEKSGIHPFSNLRPPLTMGMMEPKCQWLSSVSLFSRIDTALCQTVCTLSLRISHCASTLWNAMIHH